MKALSSHPLRSHPTDLPPIANRRNLRCAISPLDTTTGRDPAFPQPTTNSRSPKASTSLYLFCIIINIYSTIRSPVSEKMSCHDYLISAACHSSVIRYPSTIHIPHNRFIIIICLTWYYILEGDQLEWVDENKTCVFCAELSYNNSLHLFLAWIKKTMW